MYTLRKRLKINNQKDFCEKLGISEQQLSYIQNKKRDCSKVMAYCITKHYNEFLEINDLFDRR